MRPFHETHSLAPGRCGCVVTDDAGTGCRWAKDLRAGRRQSCGDGVWHVPRCRCDGDGGGRLSAPRRDIRRIYAQAARGLPLRCQKQSGHAADCCSLERRRDGCRGGHARSQASAGFRQYRSGGKGGRCGAAPCPSWCLGTQHSRVRGLPWSRWHWGR